MRFVALTLFFVALTQAAARRVTVLVDFEKPHSVAAMAALQQQLTALLQPAGVAVELMLKSDMPSSPEFDELVMFHMKGSCAMNPMSGSRSALHEDRGPLAMTYSSDGQILHFGAVECDRVRQCLQLVFGPGDRERHQAAFGTALGIVIAHELYHMLAGAKAHTRGGLTKESLTPRELMDSKLAIPFTAREALRRARPPSL